MFCILDLETGKVKTTNHLKFNDSLFPNKNQENLDNNAKSFVVSGSLDVPINPQANSDCCDTPKAPNNLELSPNDQRESDKNHNKTINTLWQYKGYTWTTQPVDSSKEIMSNLEPVNILTNSCQTKQ
ncbi:hypothetical protein O181_038503 [Austropuccinia psidii MF-1]|uniref:Uncharacterized protein n=1 Tax=Austropuccinia psidii MF-1 TaxID=1389203 RepID=A0A9Q3HB27_9BASI|nr:hypothetical protein [Austropuccinia psidii MF-1]